MTRLLKYKLYSWSFVHLRGWLLSKKWNILLINKLIRFLLSKLQFLCFISQCLNINDELLNKMISLGNLSFYLRNLFFITRVAVVQSLSHVWLFPNPMGYSMPGFLPSPSLTPGVCSDLCPLSEWCHPTISSSVLLPSILSSIRVFPSDLALHIE